MPARRNTWQREAVRQALGGSDGFVSAQALHAGMRGTGSEVGLATVYRTLADLALDGDADTFQQEGEALYRACTPGSHHHHLICRRCGTAVEIAADPVEQWARDVAAEHGFTQPEHVVDVFGLCAACTAELAAQERTEA
jgi:Fur family transcriptional regulator, ferric uptake regulator